MDKIRIDQTDGETIHARKVITDFLNWVKVIEELTRVGEITTMDAIGRIKNYWDRNSM